MCLVDQIEKQTHGLYESLQCVKDKVAQSTPYDGCLAFSQGCALATVLVALQELKQSQSTSTPQLSGSPRNDLEEIIAACNWNFTFAMLCSGHGGACPVAHDIVASASPLQMKSLHLFGAPGGDKQVQHDASLGLLHRFSEGKSIVHNKGHIIPASRTDVQVYADFFVQSVVAADI